VITYFDTSAFLKLVVEEPGSPAMVALWEASDRRLSSQLLYPEARAALAAAGRSGRVDAGALRAVASELERLWSDLDDIALSQEITARAGDLADDLALLGADAVHLATAEAVIDVDDVVACADERLASGARALGLAVAPA
jgi:predicted nucleic acid-binding protein